MLLEAWKKFEYEHGTSGDQMAIDKRMPKKVKKRRKVQTEDGSDAGWEEYFDYIFPDDSKNAPNFKLLQMAKMWKTGKQAEDSSSSEEEDDDEDDDAEEEDNAEDTEQGDNTPETGRLPMLPTIKKKRKNDESE